MNGRTDAGAAHRAEYPVERPVIFVTSLGRTGTHFFGRRLSRMIDGCHSVHDPDVVWVARPGEWWTKIRRLGFHRAVLGRFDPRTSTRALNIARQTGRVSDDRAVATLLALRRPLIEETLRETSEETGGATGAGVFLEANGQLSSLVDLLPRAFPRCRIAYIVRDPRDWIRSWMNIPSGWFGPLDVRRWVPGGRLTARAFPDDPDRRRWRRMSRFERLCWSWAREGGYGVAAARRTPHARIWRYEDLFAPETRRSAFEDLLDFVTRFPTLRGPEGAPSADDAGGHRVAWRFDPELLDDRIHSTREGDFGHWTGWRPELAATLQRHCGELMEELGYGDEPEWRELLGAPGSP